MKLIWQIIKAVNKILCNLTALNLYEQKHMLAIQAILTIKLVY